MAQPIIAINITFMWVYGNMVKMQITGENDFEKDGSYEKLWPQQNNVQKKDNFRAISFVKGGV